MRTTTVDATLQKQLRSEACLAATLPKYPVLEAGFTPTNPNTHTHRESQHETQKGIIAIDKRASYLTWSARNEAVSLGALYELAAAEDPKASWEKVAGLRRHLVDAWDTKQRRRG